MGLGFEKRRINFLRWFVYFWGLIEYYGFGEFGFFIRLSFEEEGSFWECILFDCGRSGGWGGEELILSDCYVRA